MNVTELAAIYLNGMYVPKDVRESYAQHRFEVRVFAFQEGHPSPVGITKQFLVDGNWTAVKALVEQQHPVME